VNNRVDAADVLCSPISASRFARSATQTSADTRSASDGRLASFLDLEIQDAISQVAHSVYVASILKHVQLGSKEGGYLHVHEQLLSVNTIQYERASHRELVNDDLELLSHFLQLFSVFIYAFHIGRLVADPCGYVVAFSNGFRMGRKALLDGVLDPFENPDRTRG
jgi:hypothetical protein